MRSLSVNTYFLGIIIAGIFDWGTLIASAACVWKCSTFLALQDSEAGQMAAPDALAREEADLRTQREEGAKKALKVGFTASHQQVVCFARTVTEACAGLSH